jgi:hypothetical protein
MAHEDDPFTDFAAGEADEELTKSKSDKFSPKEGELYRVSLARWHLIEKDGRKVFDMDKDPRFVRAKVNYIEGAGYVVNKGPEWTRIAGEDPQDRIATIVISWPIKSDGTTNAKLIKAHECTVLPWVFSAKKYQQIIRRHNLRGLGTVDLQVACTNTQFQHLDFETYKDSFLRKIMENDKPSMVEWFDEIRAEIEACEKRLKGLIGYNYSLERLREKLGMDDPGELLGDGDMVADSDEEFDNIMDGLGV